MAVGDARALRRRAGGAAGGAAGRDAHRLHLRPGLGHEGVHDRAGAAAGRPRPRRPGRAGGGVPAGLHRAGKSAVTVQMLLAHTSGLPVGAKVSGLPDAAARRAAVLATPLLAGETPGRTFRYSSVGLMVAAQLVEQMTGQPLDEALRRRHHRPARPARDRVPADPALSEPADRDARMVATDARSSRGLLRGVVHDDVANILGGVAGHAGLFATAADVAVLGEMLLGGGELPRRADPGRGDRAAACSPTSTPGCPRSTPTGPGRSADHGLGVELNQPWFMGRLASPQTFGHTGFTGTSLLVDRPRRLVLVLLTNRAHPNWSWANPDPMRAAVANVLADAIADLSRREGQARGAGGMAWFGHAPAREPGRRGPDGGGGLRLGDLRRAHRDRPPGSTAPGRLATSSSKPPDRSPVIGRRPGPRDEPVLDSSDVAGPDPARCGVTGPRRSRDRSAGGTAGLSAALAALRQAVADVRFPLQLPEVEATRHSAEAMVAQLDDYLLPRLARLDAPAARGRRRVDRRRQVDAGQQPGPGAGEPEPACCGRPPAGRCWSATPTTPAGSPRPGCCRTSCAPATPDRRRRLAAGGRVDPAHARARPARRAGHRLGGGGQPGAGRAAAGRGRSVAVRHDRGPLRRRGAVGLPAHGPGARHRHRAGARPGAGRAPARPSPRTWPRCCASTSSATRRCSWSRSSRPHRTVCCRPAAVAPIDDWLRSLADSAAGPGRRGPADRRRRGRRARPGHPRPGRCGGRPGQGRRRAARPASTGAYQAAAGHGRAGRARRHACCGARCWPGGRSWSGPASSCAACRPGSAGCATGSSPP